MQHQYQEINPELLETAAKRTFVVSLELKPGFKLQYRTVVVVEAYSIAGAKKAAYKKVAKKNMSRMTQNCYKFNSVEDASQKPEKEIENASI